MGDKHRDPVVKAETAMKLLDLAFHENTTDEEALAAVEGYRRVTNGILPSVLFAGGPDAIAMEEYYAELFGAQELEIARLKGELRRSKKAATQSQRGQSKRAPKAQDRSAGAENDVSRSHDRPDLVISDVEWQAIRQFVPEKYLNENGRERIAALVVVLGIGKGRVKHPWRVLKTPENPNGWTTYYNQLAAWKEQTWWINVVSTLSALK